MTVGSELVNAELLRHDEPCLHGGVPMAREARRAPWVGGLRVGWCTCPCPRKQ